jgi:hypothetical protein
MRCTNLPKPMWWLQLDTISDLDHYSHIRPITNQCQIVCQRPRLCGRRLMRKNRYSSSGHRWKLVEIRINFEQSVAGFIELPVTKAWKRTYLQRSRWNKANQEALTDQLILSKTIRSTNPYEKYVQELFHLVRPRGKILNPQSMELTITRSHLPRYTR